MVAVRWHMLRVDALSGREELLAERSPTPSGTHTLARCRKKGAASAMLGEDSSVAVRAGNRLQPGWHVDVNTVGSYGGDAGR